MSPSTRPLKQRARPCAGSPAFQIASPRRSSERYSTASPSAAIRSASMPALLLYGSRLLPNRAMQVLITRALRLPTPVNASRHAAVAQRSTED